MRLRIRLHTNKHIIEAARLRRARERRRKEDADANGLKVAIGTIEENIYERKTLARKLIAASYIRRDSRTKGFNETISKGIVRETGAPAARSSSLFMRSRKGGKKSLTH